MPCSVNLKSFEFGLLDYSVKSFLGVLKEYWMRFASENVFLVDEGS